MPVTSVVCPEITSVNYFCSTIKQRFYINASMHCHRFKCRLCSMHVLKNSWVYDDCQRKVTRPWSWSAFHSANGGSAFKWSGIGLNKPWAFTYNLCIFTWGSHFQSHAHNIDTFTCDSAWQRVCSHCWHFYLPINGGMILVICASVSWYNVTSHPAAVLITCLKNLTFKKKRRSRY